MLKVSLIDVALKIIVIWRSQLLIPQRGETLKTFTPLTDAEIESKLALAQSTFTSYRGTSFSQRSTWLNKAADILERDSLKFARIMTTEMGKTLQSAIAEAEKCAKVCHYYADKAPEFLAGCADRYRC